MSNRVTEKMLNAQVDYLNKITDSPMKPYMHDGERCRAQIGNYHISHAYGGVCLHRMCNEGGGVTTPLVHGHIPKRELFDRLRAFIDGIEYAKRELVK